MKIKFTTMKNKLLFTLLITCLNLNAQVQVASDINKGTNGASLENFFEFKNQFLFSAQIDVPFSATETRKLWKTDGTENGTSQIDNLPEKGYFKSDNYLYYVTFREIWKTDGTENGTQKIAENISNLEPLGAFKDNFYYLAYIDENLDVGMYKTDGTTTTLIKTFAAELYASNNLANNQNAIFKFDDTRFVAYIYTKTLGIEPYISDGTEAGTYFLKDVGVNVNSTVHATTSNFYKANNKFLFINDKKQLWTTDGTEAGTEILKLFSGYNSQSIIGMTSFNNKVYLAFTHELWETDGTINGTKLVFSNINNDGGIQAIIKRDSDLLLLLERGIHLFDGTSNTTTKVSTPDITYIKPYTASTNTKTYFIANYKDEGYRIFITNGTQNGTKSIEPVWPDGATPTYIMYTLGENLIFSSGSHLGNYNIGELWISDGTNLGTKLLKDINKTGNISASPRFQTTLNDKIYFSADDNIHGKELFVFDGVNTTLVKDINPGFQSSNPFDFQLLNNKIFFKAYTLDKGYELWVTDGTEAGTKIVKDINPNQGDAFLNDNQANARINEFTAYNNELYFYANNGVNGFEPWKTDGTEAGTVLIKDINSGSFSSTNYALSNRPKFVPFKNELYFYASKSGPDYSLSKIEMWKTNGTTAGTILASAGNTLVKEGTFNNYNMFTLNGYLYFIGEGRYTRKNNLLKTDGTTSGTKVLESISNNTNAYPLNEKVYYKKTETNVTGDEIWAIDKDDNFAIVKDIVPGSQGTNATNFFIHNDYLYFAIRNATYQTELWRLSDTTEPEKIFSKDSETGTSSIEDYFDYIQKDDKLFINTKHNGNTEFAYKMYFTDNFTPLIPVLSLKNDSSNNYGSLPYENLIGRFAKLSAFLGDNIYFSGNINEQGEELLTANISAVLNIKTQKTNTKTAVKIFPNPVKNTLNISNNLNIKKGSIYSILGKHILNFYSNTIDVSKLKAGIYILKYENEFGTISSLKWIKI